MRRSLVARDELAHAALSWDMARWIDARLTTEERELVARETLAAETQLERELDHPPQERSAEHEAGEREVRRLDRSFNPRRTTRSAPNRV